MFSGMASKVQTSLSNKSSAVSAKAINSIIVPECKFKIVLVGDAGTGKSAFLKRHIHHDFTCNYTPTNGVDVYMLQIETKSHGLVTLDIWEISGQEKHNDNIEYYMNSDAAIVFFDLTSKISYFHARAWRSMVLDICPDIPIVICGNKVDIKDYRVVLPRNITIARENSYYDISVKSCYNIDKPFYDLLGRLIPNIVYTD